MVNYFWNLDFIILKWLVWLLTRNQYVCLMDKQNRIDFICKFKIVGIGKKKKKISKSKNTLFIWTVEDIIKLRQSSLQLLSTR